MAQDVRPAGGPGAPGRSPASRWISAGARYTRTGSELLGAPRALASARGVSACRACRQAPRATSARRTSVATAPSRGCCETRRPRRPPRRAAAYARTALNVKGRGRLRIQRELQAHGHREGRRRRGARPRSSATRRARAHRQGASGRSCAAQPKLATTSASRSALYQFLMRQGFSPAGVIARRCGKFRTGRRDDQRLSINTDDARSEIRRSFLEYFEKNGHTIVPSSLARARTTTRRCSSPTPG